MFHWSALARHFRRWQSYSRTVYELSKLDDRCLADINVRRSEIPSLARKAAQRVH